MDECRSSTLDDVMRAVTMENIPFDFGPFLNMSPEGIDMLKGLLQRDPAKRLTARQAIKHPWFKLHAAYEEVSKENGLQVHHTAHCHAPCRASALQQHAYSGASVQICFWRSKASRISHLL